MLLLFRYYNQGSGEFYFNIRSDVFDAILFFYQSRGILRRSPFTPIDDYWDGLLSFGLARKKQTKKDLPAPGWRRNIWILLSHPELSLWAKIVAYFVMVVVVASVSMFCAQTVDASHKAIEVNSPFFYGDTVFTIIFTIEYVLRVLTAPRRWHFVSSILGIIDFCVIMPYYLSLIFYAVGETAASGNLFIAMRIIRLLQVTRILKLVRYSDDLKNLVRVMTKSTKQVLNLMFFFMMGVVLCSSILYFAEKSNNPTFDSIPSVFWFAIVTMTTVGYGDMVPLSPAGQVATFITIFVGTVTMFLLFLPVYMNLFEEHYVEDKRNQYECIPKYILRGLEEQESDDDEGGGVLF